MRPKSKIWRRAAALFGVIPLLLLAYEYGPDPGYANVPGELGTCAHAGCHLGTANDPANRGSVSIAFPGVEAYVPGVKQHFVITVADPVATQKTWGFQLSARVALSSQTQAGTFSSSDANTLVMCASPDLASKLAVPYNALQAQVCPSNMPLQYIEQSATGYAATKGPGSGSYQFDWSPPATNVGNIFLYVAGIAANGDLTTAGDHVYASSFILTPASGGATPVITEVDNAFSNLPNSPIQPTSWVVIKGSNLSSTNPGRGWNSGEFFPLAMDGTSVTINNKPAFIYFISPTQVNVQAPTDSALGPVNLVVTNNGLSSAAATATYQTNSPALLQWGGGQYPYALITNTNGYTGIGQPTVTYVGNPSVIPGTVSAHAGDILTLWATGLGPTTPAVPAGQQPTVFPYLHTFPSVAVGGVTVDVLDATLRYAGLYQVNIQLPASLPVGDLPIKIIQMSFQSPDGILINIQ